MAKKVTIDNLASEVEKILEEYGDEVDKNLDEVVMKIGKKGVQALKNVSLDMFPASGKHKNRYGSTWTYTAEHKRLYTLVTIHNRQPGLPHLLEFGHNTYNGTGRCEGDASPHPHIAKVEEKLIKDFEAEVERKL